MDSLTYSSHFALSFSSGILFKNIFIRVTKLPVFKLLPTEKQLFHGYNNSEYNVLISCKFVPRNWVKLLHSSWEAEMMPYHTCFFPAKNLSVVYWSHTHVDPRKNLEKHFEQKSRTLPIIQRRRAVKDATYAVAWIFSGLFVCNIHMLCLLCIHFFISWLQ